VTRRLVLLLLGTIAGAVGVASCTTLLSSRQSPQPPPEPVLPPGPLRAALEALLETILPDGEYPGYRTTGVLAHVTSVFILAQRPSPPLRDLLDGLDRRARARADRDFAGLGPAERREVLLELERRPEAWALGFGRLRTEAFNAHYAHPAVWKALGFRHPPQPSGYMDYQERPGG